MRTADGVLIVEGLRVMTNNFEVGTVVLEPKPHSERNENNGHVEWWFYVRLDSRAQLQLMSESRVTTRRPSTGERVR
jgi:hypothetical protein